MEDKKTEIKEIQNNVNENKPSEVANSNLNAKNTRNAGYKTAYIKPRQANTNQKNVNNNANRKENSNTRIQGENSKQNVNANSNVKQNANRNGKFQNNKFKMPKNNQVIDTVIANGVTAEEVLSSDRAINLVKPKARVKEYNALTQIDEATTQKNMTNKNKKLKVVFLGGVGEIGKNMTALEYGNDIIIIDSGLTFPNDEMPGIDVVVPDITYLLCNKQKIRGIVVTHGHEDHIGGLPYVLNEINTTVYGSKLSIALIENKMREHTRVRYNCKTVKAGQKIKLGCFEIEFINVNHSIAGSFALAIKTPIGMVVHTGDFKIDFTPIKGETTDLTRFAELGRQGVQLLLCESTNAERKGYSMSERQVGQTLDELFEDYKDKRLFIATFASNVYRLQQIMNLAMKYKRKIAFGGRSMVNVSETGLKIGELEFDKSMLIDMDRIGNYKDNELLIVSTGSQGEPMSALSRMSQDEFSKVHLGPNDCVIISASPIPGNEKSVYNVINNLYKHNTTVIYHELADVHASGHACQEELKIIHKLVKPKFFMPVHGEYRHQKIHKDLAMSMGMEEQNIFIADLGNVVEVSQNSMVKAKDVTSGDRLVDGLGVGDLESFVLKDRKQMALDGVCVVNLHFDYSTGSLKGLPEIYSRGLIYTEETAEIISEAKTTVMEALKTINLASADRVTIKGEVKKVLTSFFSKKVKRKPLIITII